ncbi:hypothetical protein [Methanococcoides sp. FTZ1]|uniref:hypothetical protein n=1 Tax=Methanococcoides sp. FTZ1 TaxID=3439061 RepID=UPI003F864FD3
MGGVMYTTAGKVRKILPTLLWDEEDLGTIASGTSLTLTTSAKDVPTILKDSSTLVKDTDFTFVLPRSITLNIAAAGENFTATCYYSVSDTDLEVIIARADRRIDAYFGQHDTPDSSYCEDWSSALSAAMYLREYATATEENLRRADALEKQALDDMKRYRDNNEPEQKARTNYTYVVTTHG